MENVTKQTQKTPVIRVDSAPTMKSTKNSSPMSTVGLVLLVALVVIGGVSTGYVLAQKDEGVIESPTGSKSIVTEKVVGSLDEEFKDDAQGVLQKGGIDGEGTHHLERDGGPTQNVYLTSSVVDLDEYAGHSVKVWGQTFAAQKAGWLMDVGKLEVLD